MPSHRLDIWPEQWRRNGGGGGGLQGLAPPFILRTLKVRGYAIERAGNSNWRSPILMQFPTPLQKFEKADDNGRNTSVQRAQWNVKRT